MRSSENTDMFLKSKKQQGRSSFKLGDLDFLKIQCYPYDYAKEKNVEKSFKKHLIFSSQYAIIP